MASKLKVLIPTRQYDLTTGKTTLAPFKVKQFPQALDLVEKYAGMIFGTVEDVIDGETIQRERTGAEIVQEILSKSEGTYQVLGDIEALLSLVCDGLAFDELGYDEAIALLAEVIEMNMDFFKGIGQKLRGNQAETNGESQPAPSAVPIPKATGA